MTIPTDPSLATPAHNNENTETATSGGCQQSIVLPEDLSQNAGSEGLGKENSPLSFLDKSNGDLLLVWSIRKRGLVTYEEWKGLPKISRFHGLNWFGRFLLRLSGVNL